MAEKLPIVIPQPWCACSLGILIYVVILHITECDVLPSGFKKYYKNDTELALISTIYTELTAQK